MEVRWYTGKPVVIPASADAASERRLAELRSWIKRDETWALSRLHPVDLAFVIGLLDLAATAHHKERCALEDALRVVLARISGTRAEHWVAWEYPGGLASYIRGALGVPEPRDPDE